MIKINRGPCPEILVSAPRAASSYNSNTVTDALSLMQYGKCAYCERDIRSAAHVDHYIPREEFVTGTDSDGKKQYNWDEANKWENLIYSCIKCNGAKKVPPFRGKKRVIIDPTNRRIDPEKFIDFKVHGLGTLNVNVSVTPIKSSPLARNTIKNLRLDVRDDHIGDLQTYALELGHIFLNLIVDVNKGKDLTDRYN